MHFTRAASALCIQFLMWEGKRIRSAIYFWLKSKCSEVHPINNKPFCMTKWWRSTIKAKLPDLQINDTVCIHNNFALDLHLCLNHNDLSSLPVNPTSVVVGKKTCCVFALHLSCENVKITNEVQSCYLYGCVSAGGKTSLCLRNCLNYLVEASVCWTFFYFFIFFLSLLIQSKVLHMSCCSPP